MTEYRYLCEELFDECRKLSQNKDADMVRVAIVRIREVANKNLSFCKKCGGYMKHGKAIEQTWVGSPDFPGDTQCVTMSPGGSGSIVDCLKCEDCGWSITK